MHRQIGAGGLVRQVLTDELAPLLDRKVAPYLLADEVNELLKRGRVNGIGQIPKQNTLIATALKLGAAGIG